MSARMWLLGLVLVGGCDLFTNKGQDVLVAPGDDDVASLYDVSFALEGSASTAGESVPWFVTVVDPDGEDLAEFITVRLATDLETDLLFTGSDLTATVAGLHVVAATVFHGDLSWVVEAPLQVAAAEAYRVELELSDYQAQAGHPLDVFVTGEDVYGNSVPVDDVEVVVDSIDVTYQDDQVWSTVVGVYQVTATMGDSIDHEPFAVTPEMAATLAFSLTTTELEVGQTTHANIEILDVYGNVAEEEWDLTAIGDGISVVSGKNVTFQDEGWYTVAITVDGTTLSDAVGPFLIDSSPPDLVITNPDRASWVAGSGVFLFQGNVTDAWSDLTLTVDGNGLVPTGTGDFVRAIVPQGGLNIIQTVATDSDGNYATDTRAVMAGDELPYGTAISEGIKVRLRDGPGGLDELGELAKSLIEGVDFMALIPNPLFYEGDSSAFVRADVTGISFGEPWIDITPVVPDKMIVSVEVPNFYIGASAQAFADVLGLFDIDIGLSGAVTVDTIELDVILKPVITDGSFSIELVSSYIYLDNFDISFLDGLQDLMEWLGFDVDDYVRDIVEDLLQDLIEDNLPTLFADALDGLELGFDVPIAGVTLHIAATPESFTADPAGFTIDMATAFTSPQFVDPGTGSVFADFSPPGWTDNGMNIAVSLDAFNQLLHVLWGAGLITMPEEASELGIEADQLSLFFPGVTDPVALELNAPLQPAVGPSETGLLELRLGDLGLGLYGGTGVAVVEASVSAIVGLDVEIVDGSTISAGMGDMEMFFDVVTPPSSNPMSQHLETIFAVVLDAMLPDLLGGLSAIEVPTLEGFTLVDPVIETSGTDDGYLLIGTSLDLSDVTIDLPL